MCFNVDIWVRIATERDRLRSEKSWMRFQTKQKQVIARMVVRLMVLLCIHAITVFGSCV